ncbi:MAG: sigma-70 family RNA polymerase sigma factor [Rhodothermales bacterium]|nr:sigma-70 family RNA polymerase sigma factor [Rhodothermales bacterium]MBO6778442.1 sigma-70 family RNA polymerase sigma factor [Rhodothermales bacterium]
MQHRDGDEGASGQLFALVYDELHAMAHRQLRFRSPGETINTTGLVHEAYLKLFNHNEADWNDRVHFFAVTARAMRQILVDHARANRAQKRGGDAHRTELVSGVLYEDARSLDLLDLEDALTRLSQLNPRMAQIVEMRFYGGMSVEEIAVALDLSSRTVDRDWFKAKSFLYLALKGEEES